MKLFVLNSPNSNGALKTSMDVLQSTGVQGVSLNVKLEQFMSMGGTDFNGSFLGDLKNEIRRVGDYGKEVKLSVMCGDYASNIPGVKYVYLIEANGQGDGEDHGISVPVPYDLVYLDWISRFLVWLSDGLKLDTEVYRILSTVVVTGNNQATAENRTPDQDFTGGDAYYNAAVKWKAAGYTVSGIKVSTNFLMMHFKTSFPDKDLVFPIIGGLAGNPCINNVGAICKNGQRPDTTRSLVNDYAIPQGIMPGWCYLKETNAAPDYVSVVPCFYQTQNKVPASRDELDRIIQNGVNQNGQIIEIQYKIFKAFPI